MREKLKALWAKVPSFNKVVTSLDESLQKMPGMAKSEEALVNGVHSTETIRQSRKTPEKSFFQKTFRGDERLKLEAYNQASTEAEKEAILKTMKDFM